MISEIAPQIGHFGASLFALIAFEISGVFGLLVVVRAFIVFIVFILFRISASK